MWFARLMCCMSGSSSTALCARNAHITLYDVTTWSWVNLVNPNKERPLGEVKWAWHWKSRGTWAGPCDHLHTWVGLSFLELLAIAVQSMANVQKPEVGGAGHVNARHGWGWT